MMFKGIPVERILDVAQALAVSLRSHSENQDLKDKLELAQLQRDMLRDALSHYVGDTEPYAPKCVKLDVDVVEDTHDVLCLCGHIRGCHAPSLAGDRYFCDGCKCEYFEPAPPGWTPNADRSDVLSWDHANGSAVCVSGGGIFATDDVGANVVGPHADVLQAMHRAIRQSEDAPDLVGVGVEEPPEELITHSKHLWGSAVDLAPAEEPYLVTTEIILMPGFRGLDCEKHGFHPHQRVKGTGTYMCCACVKEK